MARTTATSRGPLAEVDGFRGTVLARFPGSLYLARSSPTADLLVVHDSAHGHTPTSVLVDRTSFGDVRAGDDVFGRAGYLRAGDLIVDVRQAAVWTPPAVVSPSSSTVGLERSCQVLRERRAATPCAIVPFVEELIRVLGDHDDHALERALTAIIGRGRGLTPSGDDAIVGMLGVLQRVGASTTAAAHLRRLQRTVPSLLERTTPISAHYLRLALRGAFSERLTVLLDTIAGIPDPGGPRHERLDGAVDAVVAVGATSGADALAGIALTVDWLVDAARARPIEDAA